MMKIANSWIVATATLVFSICAQAADSLTDVAQALGCVDDKHAFEAIEWWTEPEVLFFDASDGSGDSQKVGFTKRGATFEFARQRGTLEMTPKAETLSESIGYRLERIDSSKPLYRLATVIQAAVGVAYLAGEADSGNKSAAEIEADARERIVGPNGGKPFCHVALQRSGAGVGYSVSCGLYLDRLWVDDKRIHRTFVGTTSAGKIFDDVKLHANELIIQLNRRWAECTYGLKLPP